ncbi:MAG: bacillithiol biosynthesis cysteine-adding enzyme BshC [Vicinamibacteria bacterium]
MSGSAKVLPYGTFPHPPSHLFRDYLDGAPGVRPFYVDDARWDDEALVASADRVRSAARPLAAVAEALARQQEARGGAAAAANARRLAQAGAVAVVTGQQPVVFGGPLFVLYKALAAITTAERMQERLGTPVVPVFWVASDDHDFAEVRSVTVVDDAGSLRTLRYAPAREPSGQPASRVILDESIAALLDELRAALPAGLHRDAVVERVAKCYRPGASLSSAFAQLVSEVFPDLVVLDPSDAALKTLMQPVLSRELSEGSPSSRTAIAAGQRLLDAGYHQQVPLRDGFFNLFLLMEGERRALAVRDGAIEVRGLAREIPLARALQMLEAAPADWSPGALLRPLTQDLLLPTLAYVGGPAEVAYHAQIGGTYTHFGVTRPIILPRPSVTVVEPAQARALETESLSLCDLQADPETVLARWARDAHPEIEAAFTRARDAILAELSGVEEALGAVDPTLRAAAESAKGRALHQVESLQEKSTRALKKRDQVRGDRLRRTRDALLPGGSLQERGLGWIGLLARQGDAVVAELKRRVDPQARGHQLVTL